MDVLRDQVKQYRHLHMEKGKNHIDVIHYSNLPVMATINSSKSINYNVQTHADIEMAFLAITCNHIIMQVRIFLLTHFSCYSSCHIYLPSLI